MKLLDAIEFIMSTDEKLLREYDVNLLLCFGGTLSWSQVRESVKGGVALTHKRSEIEQLFFDFKTQVHHKEGRARLEKEDNRREISL